MANEFARNIQDKLINPVPFALPAAASTSTNSTNIDFGTDLFKIEEVELELAVPALSATIVPDTRTVTLVIESSNDPTFATITRQTTKVLTGAGGVGVGASTLRARLASDSERYVRFKVTFGASTTTGAAINATGSVRF